MTRKVLFLVGILILVCSIFYAATDTRKNIIASSTPNKTANSISWQEYSPSVFEQAKSAHRQLLLFWKSDSCHWCKQMEEKTFTDSSIIKLINDNYFPVILDVIKNSDLINQYQIISLPTIIIFDRDNKSTKVLLGYIPSEEMEKELNYASKK